MMRARGYGALVAAWCLAVACGETESHSSGSGHKDSGGGGTSGVGTGGGAGEAGAPTRGGSGGTAGAPEGGEAGEGAAGADGGDGVCEETEPVVITSEAELQAFAARGCQVLEGTLTIRSPTLRSMDALGNPSVLRVITGDLVVEENPELADLSGFSGLERIDGSLLLTATGMENLDGFESLRFVGTDSFADALVIADNPALADVTALGGLTRLATSIVIANNAALTSAAGIDRLASTSNVTIANNALLSELAGLTELENAMSLTVAANPSLATLSLPSLVEAGSFSVTSNEALATVSLPLLERAQTLTFAENQALTSVGTLDALTDVDLLVITGNPMLPQCFVDALDARLQACNMSCGGNDATAVCE
jgi:hypothetical protein